MSKKIWQPEHPTPGWLQSEMDSDLTIHLAHPDGDVPMFFRRIPAGEFRIGSRGNDYIEEPVHLVKVPQDFCLGTFTVTHLSERVAEWRALRERVVKPRDHYFCCIVLEQERNPHL